MTPSGANAFELRGWGLCNIQQDVAFDEAYVMRMLDEAARQDINYIEFIGPYYNQPDRCPIDSLVTYREFPRVNESRSMPRRLETVHAENAKFNRLCDRAHALGLETAVWCHELWFPCDMVDFYPALGDGEGRVAYTSPAFQRFLRGKYEELFETIPHLGGIVVTTGESIALDISALPAAADRHLQRYAACVHLLNTLADVCKQYQRQISVRMFGISGAGQLENVLDMLQQVNPLVRIHQKACDHGDWHNPLQKTNPRLGAFAGRFEIAEEELGQEYFGLGRFPVVYPEVLQQRVGLCRAHGVRGLVARIDRAAYGTEQLSFHNRAWDHEAQLNILAFDALLQDPQADLARVAWPWAEAYFGPASAFALKALEQGVWIFHDLIFVYPGEDASRHWRGGWLLPETLFDDQIGIFGALREAGGYRTPKELALARCRRVLADLQYGTDTLAGGSADQIRHYHALQAKFEHLLLFGEQRLAMLDILAAFEALFFHSGGTIKKKQRFLAAVDHFYAAYGSEAVDLFVDRYGARPYADTIRVLFDLLKSTAKLDTDTYNGYCNAGEV